MPACYFAYGSNMNPARVRGRGLAVHAIEAACLRGYQLAFDKAADADSGHANIVYAPAATVEGVLYHLAGAQAIRRCRSGAPPTGSRFSYLKPRGASPDCRGPRPCA
jgi:hypothetical protein